MRIAMVVPPWSEVPPPGYGGIEQVCADLIDALAARGHRVTLIGAGEHTGAAASFVSTVREPPFERLGHTLPELRHAAAVERLLAAGGFDVVHDHTVPGVVTAPQRPIPTVATVHGSPTGELGDVLRSVDRSVAMVAISYAQRGLGVGLPWTATIHNGLAKPPEFETPQRPEVRPVMWLGRFNPDKGPDLAIHACREAGLPLVLAGKANEDYEQRYLEDVIRPMLHEGVEIIVNGSRDHTNSLLAAARCLILPIRWEEPFGMVMIEAMAVGTPVVALRHGAAPEVVVHNKTGLICDDPGELPDALHAAGDLDPAVCSAHVRDSFSADLMARRYERVYRRWAATGPPLGSTAGGPKAAGVPEVAAPEGAGVPEAAGGPAAAAGPAAGPR
jgi:glycosyltransferase involved in cell wall biosynthesis